MWAFCVYFQGHQRTLPWRQQCLKLNVVRVHTALKWGNKLFWHLCSGRLTAVQRVVNCTEWSRPDDMLHWTPRLSVFDSNSVWFMLWAGSLLHLQWGNILVICMNNKPIRLHTGWCTVLDERNNCIQCTCRRGYTLQSQIASSKESQNIFFCYFCQLSTFKTNMLSLNSKLITAQVDSGSLSSLNNISP